MSWSYIPRWKFTDSCGRPPVPGGIHVGCTHDGHMQHGHATLDARCSKLGLRSSAVPGLRQLSAPARHSRKFEPSHRRWRR